MPTIPPTLTDAPASPDRADRATFSARSIALDNFTKNVQIPEMRLALENVASNAGEAVAAAGTATTQAAAVAVLAAAALAAPGTSATSTASLTVGTGAKTLTIQAGKSIVPGMGVRIARTSDAAGVWMYGDVTAYDSGTGVLNVTVSAVNGAAGPFTDWTASLAGVGITPNGTETLTNKTFVNATFKNYTETLYAHAAGAAFAIDLANGTIQKCPTNANATITLPASVAGKSYQVMVAYGGVHSVTWAGGSTIKWANGAAPTASSTNGKIDKFVFDCDGTNTYGRTGGSNY